MFFWIFMMIMLLLIPFIMIGFGKSFINHAPKDINFIYGYRTAMSMKNLDTWQFAHRYCGKIWWKTGWIMLVISFGIMLFTLGKNDDTVSTIGGVVSGIQIIFLLLPVYFTEKALKKEFDKDGRKLS